MTNPSDIQGCKNTETYEQWQQRTSKEKSNPHAKWLRELASHMRADHNWSHANTCDRAADEIDAIASHRDTLLAKHETASAHEPRARLDADVSQEEAWRRLHPPSCYIHQGKPCDCHVGHAERRRAAQPPGDGPRFAVNDKVRIIRGTAIREVREVLSRRYVVTLSEEEGVVVLGEEQLELVERPAPTKEVKSVCPECKGARQICTGNSGSESDGYAPILERCEACDGSGLGEGESR